MAAMQPSGTHVNSNDRSVVVLKTSDVTIRGNEVFMPILIEMSQIKKPEREQFKKVEITKEMTERDVTEKLLETFPYLRNQRFYCAAAADGRTRLDFNGDRRIWNGRLIKRLLKGNSALYIFVDEQVPGCANMAPQSEASSRTAVATATQNRVDLDATLVSSSHSLPMGTCYFWSSGSSGHKETQPAQAPFCASSVRCSPNTLQDSASPEQLKRPPEQMTFAETELSNQTFKKLRATKCVSNNTEKNVAGDQNAGTLLRARGTATAQGRVSDSYQTEGQLQNLSCRNTDMKESTHVTGQFEPSSFVCHPNPAIQDAKNTWTSEHDNHVPLQQFSGWNSPFFNLSNNSPNVNTQVIQAMETDTLDVSQDVDPVARSNSKVSSDDSLQIVWLPNFDYLEHDAADSDPDWLLSLDFDGGDPSAVTPTHELTASSSYSSFDSIPSVSSFNVGIQGQMNDDQNQKPEPLKALHPQVPQGRCGNSSDSGLGSHSSSSGPQSTDMSENENNAVVDHAIIEIFPDVVGLRGAPSCEFPGLAERFPEVQSGYYTVEGVKEEFCWEKGDKDGKGDCIPPSTEEGEKTVIIWSLSREKMGEAKLLYVDRRKHKKEEHLKTYVRKVTQQIEDLAVSLRDQADQSEIDRTQHSEIFGSARKVQALRLLIHKAAQCGFQWDSFPLSEFAIMMHDLKNAAINLEKITDRFARDIAPESTERISCSELLEVFDAPHEHGKASDASEDESHQLEGSEDSDSSYFGDVESLTSDSAQQTSDSDDDLSEVFSKVSVKQNEIQIEENIAEKDGCEIIYQSSDDFLVTQFGEKETQETHIRLNESIVSVKENFNKYRMSDKQVTSFSGHIVHLGSKGNFSRSLFVIKRRGKPSKHVLEKHYNFQANTHFDPDLVNLPKIKGVHQPFISSLLTINVNTESINRYFSTKDERWRIQLQLQRFSGIMATSSLPVLLQEMQLEPEEGTSSFGLTKPAFKGGNAIAQALESLDSDGGLSSPREKTSAARLKEFGRLLPNYLSRASDVVILTSIYRPTKRILLSVVADREDVFPSESWFKDEDCEVLMENWNWQRCRLNLVTDKVKRIQDRPANVSIKKKKQGLSLGCPKDVAPTVVKKLEVQDNRTPFDSDDEMHSTDAYRDEREEEKDTRMENNDSANERESTDDYKIDRRGDGHSFTTQASRGFLHKAAISGLYETIKMLLESGEDVDQRDQFSLTPLHLACWYGQESVVKLLLERGANVNAEDRFQRTPLQKAERQNHHSIVQLLLKNDAKPSFHQPVSSSMASSNEYTDVAFQPLSLPTVKSQDLEYQQTFPTKNLTKVFNEVHNLKQEVQEKESQRQVLEDKLQNEAPSFCVLPPKPSHEIGGRESEVAKIVQQLRELNESSDNRLSYLYISGNPGSGKSQLAGLVGERFFLDLKEIPCGSSFVMTLNAASPDSLLESYASFARHLKCPDYSIVETLSLNDSTVDEKIISLKMLVAVKIAYYTSWLLVVDNVTSMSSVNVHLPRFENEAWARGHVLITTQDTTSIPSESSFVKHISVSKGMEPNDARSLFSKLSGIPDSELVETVAQRLDYQPLALAGAAVFVEEIRQDKVSTHFGWEDYLKILEEGKRQKTENTLVDTNPVYPNSMTKAITLAVETLMRSDKVEKHLFTFLALCAPRPLNMDIAVGYIMNAYEEFDEADKESIRMRLKRSSLLLFQEDEGGCFIRVHQVVDDAIKTVAKEYAESQTNEVVSGVITSFNEFIVATPPENKRLNTKHIAPHLKALTMVTDEVFLRDNFFQVHDKEISNKCENLGNICQMHCEVEEAKTNFQYSLTFKRRELGPEHVDVAVNYNHLALIYENFGDFEQAKEYQQRALDIEMDKLDPEHVDVTRSYNDLTLIYRDLGDFEQAKQYQQRALDNKMDKLGPEHVHVSTRYNYLSWNNQQAKEYHEGGLAIRLDKSGRNEIQNEIIHDVERDLSLPDEEGDDQGDNTNTSKNDDKKKKKKSGSCSTISSNSRSSTPTIDAAETKLSQNRPATPYSFKEDETQLRSKDVHKKNDTNESSHFEFLEVIKDHGLPTPSSNKTQPPGSCNVKIAINFFEQYLESEEMQNPVPDKLTSRSKGGEDHRLPTPRSNKIQPPGWCVYVRHQQHRESEEMQNPMLDKLTFRSKDIKDHGLPTPYIAKRYNLNLERCLESEEMQNPVPDKLTFRSKGTQIFGERPCFAGALPCKPVHFYGRDEHLNEIVHTLSESNGKRLVVITGLPGFGKSCLAQKIGHAMVEKNFQVIFLCLREIRSVWKMCENILMSLRVSVCPSLTRKQSELALRHLRSLTTRTILILDNAEDLLAIREERNKFNIFVKELASYAVQVKCVITSCEMCSTSCQVPVKLVRLVSLETGAAAKLLQAKVKDKTGLQLGDEEAKTIADLCLNVPLILHAAAAYIENVGGPQALIEVLRRHFAPLELANKEALSPHLPFAVFQTFLYDCLLQLGPELEKALISLAVFPAAFHREQVSIVFDGQQADLLIQDDILLQLGKRSLVHRNVETNEYFVHRVIQLCCEEKAKKDENLHVCYNEARGRFVQDYLGLVSELHRNFLYDDVLTETICRYWREEQHIIQAIVWALQSGSSLSTSCVQILNNAVVFLAKVMKRQDFEDIYHAVIAAFKGDAQVMADCLTCVGIKLLYCCECHRPCRVVSETSYSVLQKALELYRQMNVKDGELLAQCYSKIARCMAKNGTPTKALELSEQALQMREKMREKEPFKYAACCHDRAVVFSLLNSHEEALKLRETVLATYAEQLGEHPFLGTIYNYLGNDCMALGNADRAVEYFTEALRIRTTLLGHFHQETARTWHDLGVALKMKGDYKAAMEKFDV